MTINTLFLKELAEHTSEKLTRFQKAYYLQAVPKDKKTRDRSGNQERIQEWLKIMSAIDDGEYIIDFAKEKNIQIILDSKTKDYGAFNPSKKATFVSSRIKTGDAIGTIFHEFRHAMQYEDNYWVTAQLSPMDCILMSCAQEADAEAFCVAACWKLKMAGHPEAFEAHKKSPYGDISRAFEKMVTENPQSLEDGSAMRAAYDRWFANDNRVINYAAGTLDFVWGNILAFDNQAQKGFIPLDGEFMKGIGLLPNGKNYQAAEDRNLTDKQYRQIKHPQLAKFLTIIERSLNLTPTISNDNAPKKTPCDIREQLRKIQEKYAPKMRHRA